MSRAYIFSDEAGCFVFQNNGRASRYFLVCTILLEDCSIGNGLLELRRDMVWRKLPVKEEFHATEDANSIRDGVYQFLALQNFRIDITLLEKSKAHPETRETQEKFYKYDWNCHFAHVGAELIAGKDEISITAAALGTKKGQAVYTAAVNDVVQQTIKRQQWATFFPRAVAEPCLQVADYCAWAVQRKWERGETKWYERISAKIHTEYDVWGSETHRFY